MYRLLLVALGFAQTPATSTNTDQTTIKGCLGGSDGNYTVVEDNTGHIFKITTSSVDLKPHLSHDVTLIGHKASGASSTAADNSFAVTELNMISEHCAAAAAASSAPVTTPSETASTPLRRHCTRCHCQHAGCGRYCTCRDRHTAADALHPLPLSARAAETAVTPAADATAPAATVSTRLRGTAPRTDRCHTRLQTPLHPLPLSARLRRLPAHLQHVVGDGQKLLQSPPHPL